MTEPIVSIETIKNRARRDFMRSVNENPFPPLSAAYRTWDEEFFRLRQMAAGAEASGRAA